MAIDLLLDRLAFHRPLPPDLETLRRLHRAWRTRVPYENLDIQLGRPIRLEPEALLDKFGSRRRGGFCYEMNGALALLLREVGFSLDIVEGGVLRASHGEEMWGNHVALLVELDGERWLADTGIGDAFLEPLPLKEGAHQQGPLTYRLERLAEDPAGETWRLHHHEGGSVASFDFRTVPHALGDFAARCQTLATSPESGFARVLVAQHHRDGHELALRARTLSNSGPERNETRAIGSLDEFATVLAEQFNVPLDDLASEGLITLWEKAGEQHEAWLELQQRAATA